MKYEATSESLKQYVVPEWFRDVKFGIFLHWGIYSVPAYGDEWYARHMHTGDVTWAKTQGFDQDKPSVKEYHEQTYGKDKGYKDFIDLWKIDKYDPEKWADLFEAAGAKYVMPVGIHHDSFALYASKLTPWNSVNKGLGTDNFGWKVTDGKGRDLIGELQTACKKKGMYFGISNHVAENTDWMPHVEGTDTYVMRDDEDPYQLRLFYGSDFTEEESAQRWLELTNEITDLYHPDMTYFDMAIKKEKFNSVRREFAAHFYNSALEHNKEGVAFFYKSTAFEDGEAVLDIERGQLKDIRQEPWQTDTAISAKSWGYVEDDVYRDEIYIITTLMDIISKNGNLLLNIPPKADGSIPKEVEEILLKVGAWLKKNGEAVYATRPYKVFGEGPTVPGSYYSDNGLSFCAEDIRFTRSKDGSALYTAVLGKPASDVVEIHCLEKDLAIEKITLLETGEEVSYTWDADVLKITLSEQQYNGISGPFVMKFWL